MQFVFCPAQRSTPLGIHTNVLRRVCLQGGTDPHTFPLTCLDRYLVGYRIRTHSLAGEVNLHVSGHQTRLIYDLSTAIVLHLRHGMKLIIPKHNLI